VLIYVGFFMLPALLVIVPRRLKAARLHLALGGTVAIAFSLSTVVDCLAQRRRMPFDPHYNLLDFALGPATLTDVYIRRLPHLPHASGRFWWVVTWLGLVGATGIVFLLILTTCQLFSRKVTVSGNLGKTVAALATAFSAGYLVILTAVFSFDRYYIPLIPMLLIACVWGTDARPFSMGAKRWLLTMAALGIGAYALFAVAATHDYLAWNRTRWLALRRLTEVDHVPLEKIDGGFEFNGFYRGDKPSRPDKPWWWVEDDLYTVALGPMLGFETMRTYPFSPWIAGGPGTLLVLKRIRP
jgi:hypothetical protein